MCIACESQEETFWEKVDDVIWERVDDAEEGMVGTVWSDSGTGSSSERDLESHFGMLDSGADDHCAQPTVGANLPVSKTEVKLRGAQKCSFAEVCLFLRKT